MCIIHNTLDFALTTMINKFFFFFTIFKLKSLFLKGKLRAFGGSYLE